MSKRKQQKKESWRTGDQLVSYLNNIDPVVKKVILKKICKEYKLANVSVPYDNKPLSPPTKLLKPVSNINIVPPNLEKPYPHNPFSQGMKRDGLTFRSNREEQFYRKFLKDSGLELEQEKLYPIEGKKWKSDFYIPALDLYIEVCIVPPKVEIVRKYSKMPPQRIWLHVSYDQKDRVKAKGGRWSPSQKKWYFDFPTAGGNERFKPWILPQDYNSFMEEIPDLDNQQSANYDRLKRLGEKLKICKNQKIQMILAEEKHIDSCKTLLEIISWSKKSY